MFNYFILQKVLELVLSLGGTKICMHLKGEERKKFLSVEGTSTPLSLTFKIQTQFLRLYD